MRKSNTLPILKDLLSIALLASISLSLAALSRIRPGVVDPTTSRRLRPVISRDSLRRRFKRIV